MAATLPRTRRRGSGDDGAVFVEFALILPILLAALFGIISAAIAWNHHLGMSHSTKVASRYGSTLPNASFTLDSEWDTWLADVAAVLDANDEGTFSVNGGATLCVAYVDEGVESHSRTIVAGVSNTTSHDAAGNTAQCFDDGLTSGARVQAQLTREDKLNYFIAKRPVDLRARAVTPHEGT